MWLCCFPPQSLHCLGCWLGTCGLPSCPCPQLGFSQQHQYKTTFNQHQSQSSHQAEAARPDLVLLEGWRTPVAVTCCLQLCQQPWGKDVCRKHQEELEPGPVAPWWPRAAALEEGTSLFNRNYCNMPSRGDAAFWQPPSSQQQSHHPGVILIAFCLRKFPQRALVTQPSSTAQHLPGDSSFSVPRCQRRPRWSHAVAACLWASSLQRPPLLPLPAQRQFPNYFFQPLFSPNWATVQNNPPWSILPTSC